MPEEMKRADEETVRSFGIDSLVLMERAALAALDVLFTEKFCLNDVLVVCGTGNNGGDGAALARLLLEKEIKSDVVLLGDRKKCTPQCEKQLSILEHYGGVILDCIPENRRYTAIIDAIFGIALNRDVEGIFREAVEKINDLRQTLIPAPEILSIDLPSGVHGETGKVMGAAVKADATVTFAFKKAGQLFYPGAALCGRLYKKEIGITERSFPAGEGPLLRAFEEQEICFPARRTDGNKGTFGKVLLIAGSKNMCGASLLSARAAFRSGCGMVRIVTPEENRMIIQQALPEAMLLTYSEDGVSQKELRRAMEWCDCIAIGPGLSDGKCARELVKLVLSEASAPVVADADALNIIAKRPELLSGCASQVVITPHIGEFGRLTGLAAEEIKAHFYDTAADFARSYGIICVCKDARTIIVNENGDGVINCTGNSGMATAGSGDVLTGIISALIAQGQDPFYAAALGCALHGRAGDRGAENRSLTELMAGDIADHLEGA